MIKPIDRNPLLPAAFHRPRLVVGSIKSRRQTAKQRRHPKFGFAVGVVNCRIDQRCVPVFVTDANCRSTDRRVSKPEARWIQSAPRGDRSGRGQVVEVRFRRARCLWQAAVESPVDVRPRNSGQLSVHEFGWMLAPRKLSCSKPKRNGSGPVPRRCKSAN